MTINNNTTGTMQGVNSQAGGVWEGPALGLHGITITPFAEPSEDPYVCFESDGRILGLDELKQFIAALICLATELEK